MNSCDKKRELGNDNMIDMTVDETYAVLNAIESQQKHFEKGLFFKLQYVYARRSDEIATLKVKDIDFNNGCIKFGIAKKRKGNPSINLRLMPELEDQLQYLIQKQEFDDDDFLFIDSLDSKDNFKRNLRSYLERNSEKLTKETIGKTIKIGTHDFRKLRGQHLLDDGVGIERLQKLYQHEDVNTTMIYLEVEETQINNVLINDPHRNLMKYDDGN